MKVIITKDYNEMSEVASKLVLDIVKSNPKCVLGLATGSTPLGLYKLMIEDHIKNNTSYKDVRTVNLDEYYGLDINSDQSYVYFMRENLFKGIEIPLENTNIENGKAIDSTFECERYNKLLESLVPDVQILGIGSNGHIAFNEPGTSFDSITHVVDLKESTIKDNSRLFKSIDDVPRKAYTMGLKNIMNSKSIIIMANGTNKAKAIKMAIEDEISIECPASILRKHDNVTFIIDKEAASLLKNTIF